MTMPSVTAKDIQRALLLNVMLPDRVVTPNCFLGSFECDVLAISRAGYASEYEIKVSLQDWKNDAKKDKWRSSYRKYVAYLYYCIPLELYSKLDKVEHMKDDYGIITFEPVWQEGKGWWLSQVVQRQAKQLPRTEKLDKHQLDKIIKKGYHRYIDSVMEEAKANIYFGGKGE